MNTANREIFLFVKATAVLYLESAQKATRGLVKNWIMIIAAVAAYYFFDAANRIFAPLGMAGGFLVGLIGIVLLSLYYAWISQIVQGRKLSVRDLCQFDQGLFFNVLNVAFIFFVIRLLSDTLFHNTDSQWLPLCLQLGLVVVFNAIPEVIHQHRYDGLNALGHTANFVKENWIEWFVPLVVLVAPVLFLVPSYVLLVLAQAEPLLPPFFILGSWRLLNLYYGTFMLIPAVILANWFMLFRALLFSGLESGSRRKRIYQYKQ